MLIISFHKNHFDKLLTTLLLVDTTLLIAKLIVKPIKKQGRPAKAINATKRAKKS